MSQVLLGNGPEFRSGLFFRGNVFGLAGFLRLFRFMVLQMFQQGFHTMFDINESSPDVDLVQI